MSSCLTDTPSWIWAGQDLLSPIAVSLFGVTSPPTNQRILLFTSVADGQCGGLVTVGRFAEFLLQHADREFICENAAQFHWMIHDVAEQLGDAARVRETLWRLSAEHRLLDVQLLEQLLRLARDGCESELKPTATLMAEWSTGQWEAPDQIATHALHDKQGELPQEISLRASAAAWSLQNLYRALQLHAVSAAQANMRCSADSPYGPLGLGIQVQARIALEKPQPMPMVDSNRVADVIAHLEQQIQQLTPIVRRWRQLAECLKWKGDRIALRKDLPNINETRLRTWLGEIASELTNVEGVPFPIFQTRRGDAPIIPEDWGYLRRCDARLNAFWQLYDLCHKLHFIRKHSGQPINVNYELVPRIRPSLRTAILKELINHGLLRRLEPGRYIVLDFSGLDFRALAAWCEYRFGVSALARAYRNGEDPVDQLAVQLMLKQHIDPQKRILLAQHLLTAIAQKMGTSCIASLVQSEFNLSLDSPTVAGWEQAAFELFPELRRYQDDVADRLAANLGVNPATIEQELCACDDFSTISAQICGRKLRGAAFAKLCNLIQDLELRFQAMYGVDNPKLYNALLGCSFHLPTGRIRGKCVFARGNAEYLDLADDALKAALYAICASSGEIVAVADRTVVVWTGEQIDVQAANTRASDAAMNLLNVPVKISYEELISE